MARLGLKRTTNGYQRLDLWLGIALAVNMAAVAFQTLPEGPLPDAVDGAPPHFVGQCLAWDVNGSVVQRHYPAFVGWQSRTGVKDC